MTLFLFFGLIFSSSAATLNFPPDFQWCVATAGHQVEGDNIHSDWWAWEQIPGKIRGGDKSGKAAFHMERLEEDIAIMKKMGTKTYRFSIEWSRIEPRQGEYDAAAVAHYHKELKLLKQNGILPMVTIHHFVQPQWFTASGGWKRVDSPDIFLRFVQKLDDEYGALVPMWVTFNEPTVLLMGGYGIGVMPPGESHWEYWDPMIHILRAHALAYRYLHAKAQTRGQEIQVGLAFHLRPILSQHWWLEGLISRFDFLLNWNMPLAVKTGDVEGLRIVKFLGLSFPWPIKIHLEELANTQDFLGVNYYTQEYIGLSFKAPYVRRDPGPGLIGTELLNWGIDPEGFFNVFKKAHELFPETPFYVTENGLNDPQDKYRSEYLRTHVVEMHRAMSELPHKILGYCHWSLVDNFEWIEGFLPRFGLIAVDYKTGERTPRPSAEAARKIFTNNSVETVP